MARLAIVGVGRIGGEVACVAASLGISRDLILYDTVPDLLRAQVLDLQHTGLDVAISTDRSEIRSADLCIFAAGMPRNPSVKTRADLLHANLPAARDCAGLLNGFSGVLITVTNPMDINNFYLCKTLGLPRERCIGFGGQLDSARFGTALSEQSIGGMPFVLGEHGEHQVPLFSRLDTPVEEPVREEILTGLRGASMEIIRGKGGTVFGPALHLARLARMVLADTREMAVCSAVLEGEYGLDRCSLGVPVTVGREGICKIHEWDLDAWEEQKMNEAGAFATELCRTAVP